MAQELILPPGVDLSPPGGWLERGVVVNETDLPDPAVREGVTTYLEENASVLDVSQGPKSTNYVPRAPPITR